MTNSNLSRFIFIIFFIFIIPSIVFAQFDNFSGRWKEEPDHKNRMQRLMEDDDVMKYTESMVNSVSDNGKNLLITYTRTDEKDTEYDHTYTIVSDMNGNLSGNGENNSVKFIGTFEINNSEQKIMVTGHYIEEPDELFGMELLYKTTENGKVLQMSLRITDTNQNFYSETDLVSRAGDNGSLSYWKVTNFIPDND